MNKNNLIKKRKEIKQHILSALILFITALLASCSVAGVQQYSSEPKSQHQVSTGRLHTIGENDREGVIAIIHSTAMKLWKKGKRLEARHIKEVYRDTLDGPDGGKAIFIIIGDEIATNQCYVPASGIDGDFVGTHHDISRPESNKQIIREKIHLVRFENYGENGVVINGTFAFVYGYTSYNGTYIYNTDAVAWMGKRLQELIDYIEYRSHPYSDVFINPTIYNELNGLTVDNKLTISGSCNDTIQVIIDVINMQNAVAKKGLTPDAAADAYRWRDTFEFNYTYESDYLTATKTELSYPGIYARAYRGAASALFEMPKYPNQTTYIVNGPQGGTATLIVNKEGIDTGYLVTETTLFEKYGDLDIVLNGKHSFAYKIKPNGQFDGITTAQESTTNVSGYFTGSARHSAILLHNETNYYINKWFYVEDYPANFISAEIAIGVGF